MLSGRVSRSRRVQGLAGQPDPVCGDRVRQAGGPVQRDIPGFIVIGEKPGRDAVMATMLRHHLTPRLGRPEDIAALVVFLGLRQIGVHHRAEQTEHLRGRRPAQPISPWWPISAPISGTVRFAVWPRPPLPGICRHSRRPSCSPSALNSDRIGVGFLAARTRHGLAGPGSGGQAGAGRNGDACRAAMAVPESAGTRAGRLRPPARGRGRRGSRGRSRSLTAGTCITTSPGTPKRRRPGTAAAWKNPPPNRTRTSLQAASPLRTCSRPPPAQPPRPPPGARRLRPGRPHPPAI